MNQKIRHSHLQRQAFVYLRQSSQGQVEWHKESTERQYALAERAAVLGWDKSQICVLDSDLGKSGTSCEGRGDFARLMAAVSLGQAGAVLALEISRFSRSQADWHKLLDICALTDTLIVDHDGIYDPNDFNDRVLLGFKGTWSHTELHGMKLRLQGAKINKAKKGELRSKPPAGYVYDTSGRLVMDPDESIVSMVKLVFKKFQELGAAFGVARHFYKLNLKFPHREWKSGCEDHVVWSHLTHARVLAILKNPTYAGAYCYGRTCSKNKIVDGEISKGRARFVDRKDWMTFIKDAHPAYLSWEEFLENEKQLSRNRLNSDSDGRRGAARNGTALLQGLIICGKCGARMTTRYYGKSGQQPSYVCPRGQVSFGLGDCWVVTNRAIDKAVEEHVLSLLSKENVDLSLSVLLELEKNMTEEQKHWKLRLEKARFEAERARRQYDRVEPENRIVARTLEQRWNIALAEVEKLEQEFTEAKTRAPFELSPEQRQKVLRLVNDFPQIWNANTTTIRERKELLSLLVKQMSLTPIDIPEQKTKIHLLWHTGATTEVFATRRRLNKTATMPNEVLEIVRALVNSESDNVIAAALNQKGYLSGSDRPFTGNAVFHLRRQHKIEKTGTNPAYAGRGELFEGKYVSTTVAAKQLGVSIQTITHWRQTGLLSAKQVAKHGPWWFEINKETIAKLKTHIDRNQARRYQQQTLARGDA